MGVVDSSNPSEIKGLSASACKKKGIPSTVLSTPVPAFGDRDRPIVLKKVACVITRFPFGSTAPNKVLSPILKGPSNSTCGTPTSQRANAAFLAITFRCSGVNASALACPALTFLRPFYRSCLHLQIIMLAIQHMQAYIVKCKYAGYRKHSVERSSVVEPGKENPKNRVPLTAMNGECVWKWLE